MYRNDIERIDILRVLLRKVAVLGDGTFLLLPAVKSHELARAGKRTTIRRKSRESFAT